MTTEATEATETTTDWRDELGRILREERDRQFCAAMGMHPGGWALVSEEVRESERQSAAVVARAVLQRVRARLTEQRRTALAMLADPWRTAASDDYANVFALLDAMATDLEPTADDGVGSDADGAR